MDLHMALGMTEMRAAQAVERRLNAGIIAPNKGIQSGGSVRSWRKRFQAKTAPAAAQIVFDTFRGTIATETGNEDVTAREKSLREAIEGMPIWKDARPST